MSGAEAIAVLGVTSSIIAIVDGAKQVYDAAANAQGLPKAFRDVAGRLSIVRNIIDAAKQHIDKDDVDEQSCEAVKDVVNACEKKARKLHELFLKVIPTDNASRTERYLSALRVLGKGNQIETLMKGILEDVQLLACEHGMKTATKAQQEQVAKAITEVQAIPPSIPQHTTQGTGLTAIDAGNIYANTQTVSVLRSNKDEAQACLRALFLTDPRDDREKIIQTKGLRVDGTCKWIKTNELYNSWLRSQSQLLWLSGGPGKGKTMLSIFLAEELEEVDEKRNTAVAIIKGWIFQLLRLRPKLFDHILPSFGIQKESLFNGSSFQTLWRIFESMLRDPILGTTYCVLDGLDECDEDSLEVPFKRFNALLSRGSRDSSACHLKLVVVSRDLLEFVLEILSNFPRIRLDPDADTEVNDDIYRFINVKVDELSTCRHYPETLRIVATVLRKYKATEVEKALDLFPSGLGEVYARMLLQIDVDRRELGARILRWVVLAIRPLSLSELSAAIETAVQPSATLTSDEVIRDQVSFCGYFLTIKEDEVGLIHQSAKDYLLRTTSDSNPELECFRVKKEAGNLEIARRCLDYLRNGALADGEVNLETDTSHLKAFPLLSYAARHWPEHASSLARSETISNLSLFCYKNPRVFESWLKTYLNYGT
ncbi:MAG: hypothetical protein M1818_003627 [Claussenomyces sp. TS43310]|nr:MAG: hypothetical protein M1818_003627 [Claussenomyces sp. TS43310]